MKEEARIRLVRWMLFHLNIYAWWPLRSNVCFTVTAIKLRGKSSSPKDKELACPNRVL